MRHTFYGLFLLPMHSWCSFHKLGKGQVRSGSVHKRCSKKIQICYFCMKKTSIVCRMSRGSIGVHSFALVVAH